MFLYENDSRKVKKGQTFIAIKGLTVDPATNYFTAIPCQVTE